VDKRTFTRKRTQRQNDLRYYMQKKKYCHIYIKAKVMVAAPKFSVYFLKLHTFLIL